MKKTFDHICAEALSQLSERARDCVERRFGIGYDAPYTLDAIGKQHDITRERVRQIVRTSLQQVHEKKDADYHAAQDAVEQHIRSKGGIIRADRLFKKFYDMHGASIGTMRFLVSASDSVMLIDRHKEHPLEQSVHVHDFDFKQWSNVHADAHAYLSDKNEIVEEDDLYAVLAKKHPAVDGLHMKEHLHASQEISQNIYDKWGKTEWSTVKPRSIRDKVYLILLHTESPLHFREIASAIDDRKLGKGGRKTHPQTVHNELIKDEAFVLVGRGTYGLASRGYTHGKVRDLVIHVLKESNQPLTASEVVDKVCALREVKPATVKINLNTVAQKNGGTYTLE